MNGLDYGSMRLWQRKLQQSERTVDQFIQKFLLEQALEALAKAKANTPSEDPGLREAWTLSSVQKVGGGWQVTLTNSAAGASALEYGHMDSSRTTWSEGRFICTLAVSETAERLPQHFQAACAAWKGEMGL